MRAAAEGEEDGDADGDLLLEKSGAGELEAELGSDSLESGVLDDLGLDGAVAVLATAGCRSSAILFPAML